MTLRHRKEVQFAVRFDADFSSRISEHAEKNDMSKAAVVRKAVKEFFQRLEVDTINSRS